MQLLIVLTVAALALSGRALTLTRSNPRLGTWKFNAAKPAFEPGPPLGSRPLTIHRSGDEERITTQTTERRIRRVVTMTAKADAISQPINLTVNHERGVRQ
jgi:hypothetical protein